MKIGILVDSSSGLSEEKVVNTNISVIPLHIILDGGEEYLDTPQNNDKHKTFEFIHNGNKVSTSQASPGEIENKFNEMLKKYDHVVVLTISENLSSMQATTLMVANNDEFKSKISIIKHCLAADAIGELALKFNEMTANTNLTVEVYQNTADEWMQKAASIIIPGDLSRLAKGGRAKALLISILKMLKTKVAILWGWKPTKIAMGRTYTSLLDKIKSTIEKICGKDPKFIFSSTNLTSPKIIEAISEKLKEFGIKFEKRIIPSPFVCHAGTESIAFIAINKKLLEK